jgi:hypothetical protein
MPAQAECLCHGGSQPLDVAQAFSLCSQGLPGVEIERHSLGFNRASWPKKRAATRSAERRILIFSIPPQAYFCTPTVFEGADSPDELYAVT